MYLVRSHGCVHLQISQSVSNQILSYSGWLFILSVPAFPFCNSCGWRSCGKRPRQKKKIIKYLQLLHIPVSKVSCFLTERAHIFPCIPFITNNTTLAFLTRTLAAQTISSLSSSQATCICFYPLWASFLCLSLSRSSFSSTQLG